ncbi:uncharacterized protein LOC127859832 [Dreissena polymorpha]|uniref:Uncharacterized protein n=1 Tax=Dreissena polymorpha TaxID=45954 RepID=A0A9D3YUN9_DREPO|nr:uncharacterized protein LOC127859832 [Dreissena polymorpha]XP_052253301.1 uncharacterized protein LOC127859832 [Dreissena polymorpha]XP_052253302.1 uncharacterized protein LOC127859832 [Dreissena polymorpha]XP_052253304.1 uncharacterized protein LOC127859832 [Dreissena polymorpha]XP_052253305.1 uncharacterized protein LOC127859832 [Dreissena polymorpha]KAH3705445.1 hypothetical protein DPMN_080517 [Dreissena polymorpha]
MLALDVNLLTSQLQKQCLDDKAGLQPMSSDGLKLSESAQAKLGPGNGGKEVWTMPLNAAPLSAGNKDGDERRGLHRHPNVSINSQAVIGERKIPASYDHSFQGDPRPKKRNCVPSETEYNIPPAKSSWQPQGTALWKPVAVQSGRNFSCSIRDRMFNAQADQWSHSDLRNFHFSSIAPCGQRHRDTGHITPEDLLTPPESPVSRPNSVYSDGSAPLSRPNSVYSDGAVSPYMGMGDPHACWDMSHDRMRHVQEFRNRSLSVEDRISMNSGNFGGLVCNMSGSAGALQGSAYQLAAVNGSVPSSPHHRSRVPRCRSQPSFLDRKTARRRRRDLRPTLNFSKMTETAYGHSRRSEKVTERLSLGFQSGLENTTCLATIASSPHDPDHMMQLEHVFAASNSHTVVNFHTKSPLEELENANRDSVSMSEYCGGNSGPVKLLGDLDEDDMEVFQITEELDLKQIEND